MPTPTRTYTVAELSAILSKPRRTLTHWCATRDLPHDREPISGRYLFQRGAVEDWLVGEGFPVPDALRGPVTHSIACESCNAVEVVRTDSHEFPRRRFRERGWWHVKNRGTKKGPWYCPKDADKGRGR